MHKLPVYRPCHRVPGGTSEFPPHSHQSLLGDPTMAYDRDISITRPPLNTSYQGFGTGLGFDQIDSAGSNGFDSTTPASSEGDDDDDDVETTLECSGSDANNTDLFSEFGSRRSDDSVSTEVTTALRCQSYDPYHITEEEEREWELYEDKYNFWTLATHAIEHFRDVQTKIISAVSPPGPSAGFALNSNLPDDDDETEIQLADDTIATIDDDTVDFQLATSVLLPVPELDDELLAAFSTLNITPPSPNATLMLTEAQKIQQMRSTCGRCYTIYVNPLRNPSRFETEKCRQFVLPPFTVNNAQTLIKAFTHSADTNHACVFCMNNNAVIDAIHNIEGLFQLVFGTYSHIYRLANCKSLQI